jgi:hypothetical protein
MGDITLLLRSEARELVRHIAAGGSKDYIAKRAQVVNKLYGPGAWDKIRELMKAIPDELSESDPA